MPLYDYRCTVCKKLTEVRHGFDEVYGEPCAHCGGALGRVFNPAPIVFKGSGFYINDSRKSSGGDGKSSEAKASEPQGADAKPADSKPSESKPAESKASDPASGTKESAA